MSLFLCYFIANQSGFMKHLSFILLFVACSFLGTAQQAYEKVQIDSVKQDSVQKPFLMQFIGDGYFPTKYFDFDLRYLVKFNQYEGFRTGLGGITNNNFSETYKIKGYTVYGFKDHTFKYSIGGGFRISPKRNTWIYAAYTSDLEETGSSGFLTDKRLFQLFEPRLLNIDLFHKHISKTLNIEHQLFYRVVAETEFAIRKITPTYDYRYVLNSGETLSSYNVSSIKISAQWSPFSEIEYVNDQLRETSVGYPNFTIQYTNAINNVFNSDVSFSKLDARIIHKMTHRNESNSEIILVGGYASGDAPLQYLYHAYPNNVNKETIMNRFSVAGITSFETMYFNEFFSDRFATLVLKHRLKPFAISPKFQPQVVLLTKIAVGNMSDIDRHQNITFSTLEKGYTESGIEINKLILGFGLSFAYRYGAYHLDNFQDNIAFKFTFNIEL